VWNSFNLGKLVDGSSADICVSLVCREIADVDQILRGPESSGPPPDYRDQGIGAFQNSIGQIRIVPVEDILYSILHCPGQGIEPTDRAASGHTDPPLKMISAVSRSPKEYTMLRDSFSLYANPSFSLFIHISSLILCWFSSRLSPLLSRMYLAFILLTVCGYSLHFTPFRTRLAICMRWNGSTVILAFLK